MQKPAQKPIAPFYSSGPCCKRPGWKAEDVFKNALLGRSHRAVAAKKQLQDVSERSRKLLGIPADYKIAIMAGSDTGAFEAALWGMLGPRPVDVFAWEVFGSIWTNDIIKHLKIEGSRDFTADFGILPDFSQASPKHDIVFTWNGTTSGVRVPNIDWIPQNHEGLVFCDAISAVFAMPVDVAKMDVISWSWQKALGSEAQHGMLALSPKAVERLRSYTPKFPLPKIFRLVKKGEPDQALFDGDVLNTPSLLCVADVLDALQWAESIGGLPAMIARTDRNAAAIAEWVDRTPWAEFLAIDPATRTTTSNCIKIVGPRVAHMNADELRDAVKKICGLVEKEGAGYDLAGHRDAPPHIRMWAGPTLETADIKLTLQWLEWAFEEVLS
ncbi:MAG: phosphoserine transaminase [Bdellovibrionales bacterium]